MARKGLPAKYAKMGFAKGWREYKKSKKSSSISRSKPKPKKQTRRVNVMAKRKVRRSKKKSSLMSPQVMGAVASFGYGAFRNKASVMASKYIPGMAGKYGDNVVLGGIGLVASLYGRGLIKKVGQSMLNAEAFLAGNRTVSVISANQESSQSVQIIG